jgi:hypothetical protein
MKTSWWMRASLIAATLLFGASITDAQDDELLVYQVQAAQLPGTAQVDVWYKLHTVGGEPVTVGLFLSTDGGTSYLPSVCQSVTGDVGTGVLPGTDRHIVWDAGADFPGFNSTTCRLRVTADDGVYTLPFPGTPDQIIQNFVTAYGAMDVDLYRDEILSPDYTFILQAETVEEFGLPDNLYEYTDEVAIAEHMFSGQPNLEGRVLTDIEIQVLQPQGTWFPVPANDPYFGGFPGVHVRNYAVLIYFNCQGEFRYEVQGDQLFYVTSEEVMHNGYMTPRYWLLGQLDQTGAAPWALLTESTTWGAVKVIWR